MKFDDFSKFAEKIESPISLVDFIGALELPKNQYIFIKDAQHNYHYANENFIQFLGLDNINQLRRLSDFDLYKTKSEASNYHSLEDCTFDTGAPLVVCESVAPITNSPIVKTVEGSLYPLYSNHATAQFVMGIVTPQTRVLKLDWDTIFNFDLSEIDVLLVKRSYSIKLGATQLVLSKMEIKTLIQLLKGGRSGDIATSLNIKKSTVESYLNTIKNKLGVSHRSELIGLLIESKLLEQVII